MIYEPLSPTCNDRMIDERFVRLLQAAQRKYNERRNGLLKDHVYEVTKIRKEHNTAKQKR